MYQEKTMLRRELQDVMCELSIMADQMIVLIQFLEEICIEELGGGD